MRIRTGFISRQRHNGVRSRNHMADASKYSQLTEHHQRSAGLSWLLIVLLLMSSFTLPFLPAMNTAVAAEVDNGNTAHLTILHTNDEHSAFVPFLTHDEPQQALGSLARLATVVKTIRAEKEAVDEPVLLLSAGDYLGETAYGWLSILGEAAELEVMQAIGYDAVTIGNHEYDFGLDVLAHYFQTAGYPEANAQMPILAANTQSPSDSALAAEQLFLPSVIKMMDNGLKVGIFGLIGEDAVSVTSDPGETVFQDMFSVAQAQVDDLRQQGADIIIALTHAGIDEDKLLAAQVEGIHLIVGGHSHTLLDEPVIEQDTLIVQAGSQTRYLGRLELAYDFTSEVLSVRNVENERDFIIPIDDRFVPDPGIQAQTEAYTDKLNHYLDDMTEGNFDAVHASLLYSDFHLTNRPGMQESLVGNFVTDGMRLITSEVTGQRVDVAIQANGSIRSSLVPKTADEQSAALTNETGTLSFYDITNTIGLGYGQDGYPGYSVAAFYLTGQEVRRVLEIAALLPVMMGDDYFLQFSGLRYEYSPRNTILFTIPVLDQPLPSTMAVNNAWLFHGDGIQPDTLTDDYETISRKDDSLYHVVTDTYILSFLPMAGELLPQLEVVPKNRAGEPVPFERFSELTVRHQARELKVWETAALYAASIQQDNVDIGSMPETYRTLNGRIQPVSAFPLIIPVIAILILLVMGLVLLIRYFISRRRRKAKPANRLL